ncbi:Protein CBG21882 [Caenorhabditis briggsae]|uniref:Protein CBG21882 n=1 Tax=Caenorhabditis briggsae TaxID=6238 RepID=A8Y119_CAEBR|nr:Protein CBG21882 [Caenorhabditis briggsae]CAP38588.1 Protein CBG21882 [Caenorhabditis briggsae]
MRRLQRRCYKRKKNRQYEETSETSESSTKGSPTLYSMMPTSDVKGSKPKPDATSSTVTTFYIVGTYGCSLLSTSNGTSSVIVLAFLILFENRSSLIVNNIFRFQNNSTRNLWIFMNITGCMVPFIPVYFNLPDSDEARVNVLKSLPCPPKYFFTENILVFPDGFWFNYLSATILFSNGTLFLQILFFSVCCLYYLFYAKSSQVSSETRRLQIRSFFGIVLQTTIPFLHFMKLLMATRRGSFACKEKRATIRSDNVEGCDCRRCGIGFRLRSFEISSYDAASMSPHTGDSSSFYSISSATSSSTPRMVHPSALINGNPVIVSWLTPNADATKIITQSPKPSNKFFWSISPIEHFCFLIKTSLGIINKTLNFSYSEQFSELSEVSERQKTVKQRIHLETFPAPPSNSSPNPS